MTAEPTARFVRELELVGGHAISAASLGEAAGKIAALARSKGVRLAAVGQGSSGDAGDPGKALEAAGIEVVRTKVVVRAEPLAERRLPALRERLARCDLGVAEADYGIAATGTIAVASDAGRPGALSLLPPLSVIVLRAERIVPDLAALFEKLGPDGVRARRLTLITGPSRTADIEKRIVLGVHGPRELYAVLIGAGDG